MQARDGRLAAAPAGRVQSEGLGDVHQGAAVIAAERGTAMTTETGKVCCAFCQGYRDAKAGEVFDPTARDVVTAHPTYTDDAVTLYLNGAGDGQCGDDWRFFRHTLTCGGCSGRPSTAELQSPDTELWECSGCGGLIGRAPRSVLNVLVGLNKGMIAESEDDARYFDVEVLEGKSTKRVHGWYSPKCGRVTQYG